jgi:hypothetical protein
MIPLQSQLFDFSGIGLSPGFAGTLFGLDSNSFFIRSFQSLRYLLKMGIMDCSDSPVTAGNSSSTF